MRGSPAPCPVSLRSARGTRGAREARLLAAFALRAFLIAILAGPLEAAFPWAYWNDIVEKYSEGQTEALVFCALVVTCFVVHMLHAFA